MKWLLLTKYIEREIEGEPHGWCQHFLWLNGKCGKLRAQSPSFLVKSNFLCRDQSFCPRRTDPPASCRTPRVIMGTSDHKGPWKETMSHPSVTDNPSPYLTEDTRHYLPHWKVRHTKTLSIVRQSVVQRIPRQVTVRQSFISVVIWVKWSLTYSRMEIVRRNLIFFQSIKFNSLCMFSFLISRSN